MDIDPDKFRAAIKKRGYNLSELSDLCGKADSYLSNCINRKRIDPTVALYLEDKYHISQSDYKTAAPVEDRITSESPLDEDDMTKAFGTAILVYVPQLLKNEEFRNNLALILEQAVRNGFEN